MITYGIINRICTDKNTTINKYVNIHMEILIPNTYIKCYLNLQTM